jgi:hypothetical protein
MKKQNSRKLDLVRETLVPLTPDTLDAVAGGQATTLTPTISSIVTRVLCPTLTGCSKPSI